MWQPFGRSCRGNGHLRYSTGQNGTKTCSPGIRPSVSKANSATMTDNQLTKTDSLYIYNREKNVSYCIKCIKQNNTIKKKPFFLMYSDCVFYLFITNRYLY